MKYKSKKEKVPNERMALFAQSFCSLKSIINITILSEDLHLFFQKSICCWNLPFWSRNSAIIFTKKANNWLDKGLAVIGGHLITVADSNNGAGSPSLLQLPVKCAITLSNRDTLIVTNVRLLGHFPLFTTTLWRDGLHPAQTSTLTSPQTHLKAQCVRFTRIYCCEYEQNTQECTLRWLKSVKIKRCCLFSLEW